MRCTLGPGMERPGPKSRTSALLRAPDTVSFMIRSASEPSSSAVTLDRHSETHGSGTATPGHR